MQYDQSYKRSLGTSKLSRAASYPAHMTMVCVCVGYLFVHVVWLGLRTRICPMHLLYGMHEVQNTHLQNLKPLNEQVS